MASPDRERSAVLEAAFRRLERSSAGSGERAPAADPARAQPERLRAPARPVLTLDPPLPPRDPRALATILADDFAAKLDELCHVWSVIRELEFFVGRGEPSLRRRASELALVTSGGGLDLPIEALLRVARGFMDERGMDEQYVRKLCEWYLPEDRAAATKS
jgi:hypothetical protein